MEFDQKDLHPRLRGVDRALPRRKIRDKGAYDAGMIDEKSKEAAKVRLAELAKVRYLLCLFHLLQCHGKPVNCLYSPAFNPSSQVLTRVSPPLSRRKRSRPG